MSLTLTLTLPVPHVDLGFGLLQYADNRPTIITLVGMVAVGMVRVGMVSVGMVSVGMVGVGMVPAPRVIHQPVSVILQCSLMPGCRIGLRRSAPTYGKR